MMMSDTVKFSSVEKHVITIQNQAVIIDSDVAVLYGVETKRINEAVKNNPDKFPEGYIIQLSNEEWKVMKSKISTSLGPGGKVKLPTAFTEKGLYMLATILKSERATATTIAIVETFAKIQELSRTVGDLSNTTDEFAQRSLMQKGGDIISELLGEDIRTADTETTVELNFAVFKFKHTVKNKGNK